MRLLPIAQKLAEAAHTAIVFDETRCLRPMDRFSDCQACFSLCPVEAIKPGSPPILDEDACQNCRACLPVCPMGAYFYTGIDAGQALVDCVEQMGAKRFDLFCRLNPNLDHGSADAEAAITVGGCLAGLGTGAYLALVSQGVEKITVRTEACPDCHWHGLQPVIVSNIDRACAFLKPWGQDDALVNLQEDPGVGESARPVWRAESPPLSRRSLMRLGTQDHEEQKEHAPATGSFRERLSILKAVKRFSQASFPAGAPEPILDGLGFATVSVSDACTACGTCARICPTEALTFSDSDSEFELALTPQLCIGCECCAHVCAPQAITIDHNPDFNSVFGDGTGKTLQQGKLSHCPQCKASFASRTGSKLCPTCDFRHKNPFGSMLPPGLEARHRS